MTPERPEAVNKNLALVLLAAAQFVVVLDASIVNVALPSIGRDLEFAQDNLSWVVNAYVLVFGGFLLLGGRMADLLGRRRVFVGGLVLFGVASLLGGLAQNEGQLIAARAVQGLGGALLSPAALSILTTPSPRAPSATGRWASGARWPAPAAPSAPARRRAHGDARLGVGAVRQRAGRARWSPSAPGGCSSRAATSATRASTSSARSRSRPACRSSSTRWSTPATRAGAPARRSGWAPPRSRCSRSSWPSRCASASRSSRSGSSATGR